jgi:hypothetical protein
MAHGILIPVAVAAMNVDSYNRSVVEAADVDNGSIVVMGTKSTTAGLAEVFEVAQPATSTLAGPMWMAYSGDEIAVTDSKYKGLDPDPRNFFNASGKVFSAFKPVLGDIILLSVDGIASAIAGGDTHVVAIDGSYKMDFHTAVISGLSWKILRTTYISIATGAIDTQRVVAYELECVVV